MGKRKNQPVIDSDSDSDSESNNDSGSDLDSVSIFNCIENSRSVMLHTQLTHHTDVLNLTIIIQ